MKKIEWRLAIETINEWECHGENDNLHEYESLIIHRIQQLSPWR